MKTPVNYLIVALFVCLLPSVSNAEVYKIGDTFVGFSAPDQQGKANIFKAGDAKFILFDTPGESGESQSPQDPDWFAKNRALLVVNISEFSMIKRDIARSRMKSKPFKILVLDDKAAAEKFPVEKGKFTVLVLDEKGIITAIKFAAPGPELRKTVTGTGA